MSLSTSFHEKVEGTIAGMRKVLEVWRKPESLESVAHEYGDKYALAELLFGTSVASTAQYLRALGLTEEKEATVRSWVASGDTVTLALRSVEKCAFLREAKRDVLVGSSAHEREFSSLMGTSTTKTTSSVHQTITEFFFGFSYDYQLVVYQGVGGDGCGSVQLCEGERTTEVVTRSRPTPYPEVCVRDPLEHNATFHFQQPAQAVHETRPAVAIDRAADTCRTPSRNPVAAAALAHAASLATFCEKLVAYFQKTFLVQEKRNHDVSVANVTPQQLFTAVLPVMENTAPSGQKRLEGAGENPAAEPNRADGPLLSRQDIEKLLAEETRRLVEKTDSMRKVFPPSDASTLVHADEGKLIVTGSFIRFGCEALKESVAHIEECLRSQLCAAVGKSLSASDFTEYMDYHCRKLYAKRFQPSPFSHNVGGEDGRAQSDPEGVISIVASDDNAQLKEVLCMSRKVFAPAGEDPALPELNMKFALSASADVVMKGSCFVHFYQRSQFSDASPAEYALHARARQFSSFILLLGRIGGNNLFLPEHALVIKNKDDLRIPLLLKTIPSPGEFKKAVQSMSPEQARFSKAYRAMQLEGTLFGLATIQIKPQMEKLLKLPAGSLQKEIKFGQDLLELFTKYSIPADLLGYNSDLEVKAGETEGEVVGTRGPGSVISLSTASSHSVPALTDTATDSAKAAKGSEESPELQQVKASVKRVFEHIKQEKKKELLEAKQARDCEVLHKPEPEPECEPEPEPEPEPSEEEEIPACEDEWMYSLAEPMECAAMPCSAVALDDACGGGGGEAEYKNPPRPGCPVIEAPKPVAAAAKPSKPKGGDENADAEGEVETPASTRDLTDIPTQLEKRIDALKELASCVRPTVVNFPEDAVWEKKCRKGLLSKEEFVFLDYAEREEEKSSAYELLDALTKSGSLSVDSACVHVFVATTHCFDKTLMDTLVKDNVNPIEKAEVTSLTIASVLHEAAPTTLVEADQASRLKDTFLLGC